MASIRKTKKAYRKDEKFFRGASHPIPRWETSGLKRKKRGPAAGRKSNRKRKRAANPKQLLFATKAAANAYAKTHGIPKSRYSLKRMKKAK